MRAWYGILAEESLQIFHRYEALVLVNLLDFAGNQEDRPSLNSPANSSRLALRRLAEPTALNTHIGARET